MSSKLTPTKSQIAAIEEAMESIKSKLPCNHPEAPTNCTSIINAHTVSKSRDLKPIAVNGMVIGSKYPNLFEQIQHNGAPPRFHPIGLRKASTFPGFCGFHDKQLFSEIEDCEFVPTQRQAAILCYRTICRELNAKKSASATHTVLRSVFDPNYPEESNNNPALNNMLGFAFEYSLSVLRGLSDLVTARDSLSEYLTSDGCNAILETLVVEYDDLIPYVVSGTFSAIRNPFTGKILQDLTNPDIDIAELFIHTVVLNSKSYFLVSRRLDSPIFKEIFDSIQQHSLSELSAKLLEWVVSNIDNIFFDPTWFDRLQPDKEMALNEWSRRNTSPVQTNPEEPEILTARRWPLPTPSSVRII